MAHVSRQYLREKWKKAKHDMENVLEINNEELPDGIPARDVSRCIANIEEQFKAISTELDKYKY